MYKCPSCTYFFTTQEAVLKHTTSGECEKRKAYLKQWVKDFEKKFPALKPRKKKGKK